MFTFSPSVRACKHMRFYCVNNPSIEWKSSITTNPCSEAIRQRLFSIKKQLDFTGRRVLRQRLHNSRIIYRNFIHIWRRAVIKTDARRRFTIFIDEFYYLTVIDVIIDNNWIAIIVMWINLGFVLGKLQNISFGMARGGFIWNTCSS